MCSLALFLKRLCNVYKVLVRRRHQARPSCQQMVTAENAYKEGQQLAATAKLHQQRELPPCNGSTCLRPLIAPHAFVFRAQTVGNYFSLPGIDAEIHGSPLNPRSGLFITSHSSIFNGGHHNAHFVVEVGGLNSSGTGLLEGWIKGCSHGNEPWDSA